jgi:hypothetical protein
LDSLGLHAQSSAHTVGDLRPRERLIQRVERRVDCCIHNTIRYTLGTRPSDFFLRAPCGAPDEDRQLLGWHQKERAAHARCLDQAPLAEGRLDIRDL